MIIIGRELPALAVTAVVVIEAKSADDSGHGWNYEPKGKIRVPFRFSAVFI